MFYFSNMQKTKIGHCLFSRVERLRTYPLLLDHFQKSFVLTFLNQKHEHHYSWSWQGLLKPPFCLTDFSILQWEQLSLISLHRHQRAGNFYAGFDTPDPRNSHRKSSSGDIAEVTQGTVVLLQVNNLPHVSMTYSLVNYFKILGHLQPQKASRIDIWLDLILEATTSCTGVQIVRMRCCIE